MRIGLRHHTQREALRRVLEDFADASTGEVVTSAEVYHATTKMIAAYTDSINGRVLAGIQRLNLIKQIVEQSSADRRERLQADRATLGGAADEAARDKTVNRLHNDIEVIDNRLQVTAAKESLLVVKTMQSAA